MPTYEYSCDYCGNDFEVFQKMSDEPVQICPKCGKHVRKVLSGGIGISFKGSGFYVNDSHVSARQNSCPASPGSKGEGSACGGACCCGSGK